MHRVLLLVPDLFFNVKVADAVRALGGTPVDLLPGRDLPPLNDVDLLVIDTGARQPWQATLQQVRDAPAGADLPVLAFGAHVDVETQRAAVAAGCDRVVTRGKFAAEMADLLRRTARDSGR